MIVGMMSTMAQKIVQYQAVLQLAQGAPQIYDLPQLHRQMLDVLGIKNAQKLIPLPDDQVPKDPVAENMAAINNKPLKAFMYQDHQAHIAAHQMFMQDPKIAAMVGQTPNGQMLMAALQAHIAEHLGFAYRRQMEEQLGITLPPPDEDKPLPPEVEVELSKLVAEGAQRVLGINQTEMQAQQAQQAAQDPVIQMQQQELKLREQELQLKAQEIQIKAAAEADKLELEKERLQAEMELKGMQQGSKIKLDQAKFEADNEKEGVRLGAEIARNRAEHAMRQKEAMKPTKGEK